MNLRSPRSTSAPPASGWLPRRVRRRFVVSYVFGYGGLVLFWVLASLLGNPWLFAPAALCGLIFLVSFARIFYGVQPWNVANRSDAEVDERQRAVREQAHYLAYHSWGAAFGLGLVYWYFAGEFGGWLPRSYNERTAVFWTLLLSLVSLPSAIIAWLEPDPVPDETGRAPKELL